MEGRPPTGRFAPSPTGPLHHGSLVAALGSFLFARARGGRWLLRIDDLDAPRVVPGAADDILRTLEALGLSWDGPVLRQSGRDGAYEAALGRLSALGLVYPCGCSRAEIARVASAPHPDGGEVPYPGTCRGGLPPGREPRAFRLRVGAGTVTVEDGVQGTYRQDVAAACGDFVLKRADGIFAYHLATVADDGGAGVDQVARGADLLPSTPRQLLLLRLLGLPEPAWFHLPLVTSPSGDKLSKRDHAVSLAEGVDLRLRGGALLHRALRFLGQDPPPGLAGESPPAVLAWALASFRPGAVPRGPAPFPS